MILMKAVAPILGFIAIPAILSSTVPAFTQTIDSQYRADVAACQRAVYAHQITSGYDFESCFVRAEQAWLSRDQFPWMDLAYENEADHLAIARQMDARTITVAEGNLRIAASDARMAEAIKRRIAAISRQQTTAPPDLNEQRQTEMLDLARRLLSPGGSPSITTNCRDVIPGQWECVSR